MPAPRLAGDRQDRKERRVPQELPDPKDHKDGRETVVPLDLQARRALLERQAHKARRVPRGAVVHRVLPARRGLRGSLDHREALVILARRDQPVRQVLREVQESADPLALRDLLAHREPQVPAEAKVLKDLVVHRGALVLMGHRDLLELQVLQEYKELLDHRDLQVILVPPGVLDLRDHKEPRVSPDLKVVRETKD